MENGVSMALAALRMGGLTMAQRESLDYLRAHTGPDTGRRIDDLIGRVGPYGNVRDSSESDADLIIDAENFFRLTECRREEKIERYRFELNARGLEPHEVTAATLYIDHLFAKAAGAKSPGEKNRADNRAESLRRVLEKWRAARGRLVHEVEFTHADAEALIAAVKWFGSPEGESARAADGEMARYCFDRSDYRYESSQCAIVRLDAAWVEAAQPLADLLEGVSKRIAGWAMMVRDRRLTR